MNLDFIYLYILPGRIWFLKFLLEGYDGLALLTTMDKEKGLVRLAVPRGRYHEIICILDNMADELTRQQQPMH